MCALRHEVGILPRDYGHSWRSGKVGSSLRRPLVVHGPSKRRCRVDSVVFGRMGAFDTLKMEPRDGARVHRPAESP